jgi:hypothetical protein
MGGSPTFLVELLVRLNAVGLAGELSYRLPLTQEWMADVLGLSGPHINRMIRCLREEGLEISGSLFMTSRRYRRSRPSRKATSDSGGFPNRASGPLTDFRFEGIIVRRPHGIGSRHCKPTFGWTIALPPFSGWLFPPD